MSKMNQIERLIRIAYKTVSAQFKGSSVGEGPSPITAPAHIKTITDAMRSLNADDVNLHASLKFLSDPGAPVTYIRIHHNQWFSLGIFVIHPGQRIPKHDHVGMFGALKVIHGELRISSYTVQQTNDTISHVLPQPPVILNPKSEPVYLTPDEGNIHEIEFVSSDGSPYNYAAFIDFLCPPYKEINDDDESPCHYFELISQGQTKGSKLLIFKQGSGPLDFWTNSALYMGCSVEKLIEEMKNQYPMSSK